MRTLMFGAVAAMLVLVAGSVARADHRHHSPYGYRSQYRAPRVDYHPGGFYPHRNHYHYVPGHYHVTPSRGYYGGRDCDYGYGYGYGGRSGYYGGTLTPGFRATFRFGGYGW